MFRRIFGAFAAVALVGLAGAQVYLDAAHTIVVPKSGLQRPGRFHTQYVQSVFPKPTSHVGQSLSFQPMGAIPGLYPVDVRAAYDLPAQGGLNAIAIVDSFDNPYALTEFNQFATTYGLPKETSANPTASTNAVFRVVYAAGTKPAFDADWSAESSMDVQWAHAVAPYAKIYLVEAASDNFADIQTAVNVAKRLPGVKQVSMSFGADEWSDEKSLDADYVQAGVTFFAASGDFGIASYPAMSTNCVGVGGTTLTITGGAVTSETAWNMSGGGSSPYIARPAFQNGISSIVGAWRGSPDIAGPADPSPGVSVYNLGKYGGWVALGGTSASCPIMAAVANARGSYSTSSIAENTRNYGYLGSSAFRDIKGPAPAKAGWDFATGIGCPVGMLPSSQNNPTFIGLVASGGTYVSGALSNVLVVDGVSYTTQSVPNTTAYGEYTGQAVAFKFSGPPSKFTKLFFYVTLATSVPANVDVTAYCYLQGKYTSFGTIASTSVFKTTPIYLNVVPAPGYFDSNNTVHFQFKAHTPGKNTTAFTLKMDRAVAYGIQ